MARTTKKRRRKHRGTQGGGIDRRGRGTRPRTREEARARARKQTGKRGTARRGETPPTWGSAIGRAAFGAAIFFVLLILLFKRPAGVSALLSVLMLLIYIPLGHAIDGFMYRRKLRARQREHERRKAGE